MNSVITYIFGTNQEILRDPKMIDSNTTYICVTDQKQLRSKTWNVVYDTIPAAKCIRDKMVYVKYNPFKYTNADKICVIDGSIQLASTLLPFFDSLNHYSLMYKPHPVRTNLFDELNTWRDRRGLPVETLAKFYAMSEVDKINLHNNFLIESCFLGYNANNKVKQLCKIVISYMKFLGINNRFCLTNQCVLTYLLQKFPMDMHAFNQNDYAVKYMHNTWDAIKPGDAK